MSASSQDQYVFGSHPAELGEGRPDPLPPALAATPAVPAWVASEMRTLSDDSELHTLCARVAEALPTDARTAVVLTSAGPHAQTEQRPTAEVATSSPLVTTVLRIEWLLQEGPVRTSLESGTAILSGHLGPDRRWPRFGRAVLAHDTVSAAAVPIPLGGHAAGGVLAAFSQDEAAFDDRDVRVLAAFGRVMADVVTREQIETPAPDAEESEAGRLVNQAIGILITHHCDEQQALRRLRRISESTGQPLVEAARMIVNEAQLEAHLRFVAQGPRQRLQSLAAGFGT